MKGSMTYNPVFDPSLRAEHPFTFSVELRDAFAHKYPQMNSTCSCAENGAPCDCLETEKADAADHTEVLVTQG